MKKKLLGCLTALMLSVGTVTGVAQAETPTDTCEPAFFAVGGYPLANRVPDGWTSIHTPGGLLPWENGGYNHGQDVGAANVVKAVEDFAAECPDTDVYLQGHSYGAGVIHRALPELQWQQVAVNMHVYLTGDPLRVGGVDDTWQAWQPIPGIKFRGPGAVFKEGTFASYENLCNEGWDAICSMPHIVQDPVGFFRSIWGYLTDGHRYPVRPAKPW